MLSLFVFSADQAEEEEGASGASGQRDVSLVDFMLPVPLCCVLVLCWYWPGSCNISGDYTKSCI